MTDHYENSSTGDLDNNPLTAYNNNATYLNGTFSDVRYGKTQVSWTAGADYAFNRQLNGFLRANHGALMPQFDDLRGNATALQNIKPQTADQYEIGLKTSKKLYDLYLTGFYNRFHNLVFQDIRVINGVEQNVVLFGGSRAYGVEFEGALRPIAGLQLPRAACGRTASSSISAPIRGIRSTASPSSRSPSRPSYTQRTAWGKARVFGTFTHIGNRFADLENQQPLGSYNTLDLGASLDVNDRFSIQATVENVTNTLALTEGNVRTVGSANTNGYFLGRPIFGRHGTITAAYKF
jgi:outer membrane receptor protein involved in Fe transport